MDLTVDQANLTRATRLTSRATPTRSTLPVLQTVRLEAQNGGLTLTATDLEIGVTTAIAANVATPGTICVPARLLGEYISQLPSEPVHLTLKPEGHRLRLSCGRFVANLATQDAAEFPALPAGNEARALTLDASRLRQAVARVAFAAARDDARPVLTAVLFDFGPEGLTLAAADGFRLARARLAGVVADPQQLLVPVRAVTELGRLLGDAKFYSLVRGVALPPAKFSTIAEHVWHLEKTNAPTTFLVFGNDRQVPVLWLERYGNLLSGVAFYFLREDGRLDVLTSLDHAYRNG